MNYTESATDIASCLEPIQEQYRLLKSATQYWPTDGDFSSVWRTPECGCVALGLGPVRCAQRAAPARCARTLRPRAASAHPPQTLLLPLRPSHSAPLDSLSRMYPDPLRIGLAVTWSGAIKDASGCGMIYRSGHYAGGSTQCPFIEIFPDNPNADYCAKVASGAGRARASSRPGAGR